MKKKFTFLLCFILTFFIGNLYAQTAFLENFNNGISSSIKLVNADGKTPATPVSYVNDAWVSRLRTTGDSMAVSTSWYEPVGQADDWLITPAINIPVTGYKLEWEAMAPDPAYPDGYLVYISTTGDDVSDFLSTTPVFTIVGENSSFTLREIDLSSYAGQTIYIAYRNNSTDMFLLYLDNIRVYTIPPFDGAITEISSPITSSCSLSSNENVKIMIENSGLTAFSNFDVSYSINGGTPVNETVTNNINPGGTMEYTFTAMANLNPAGEYEITATIIVPSDGEPLNDIVTKKVYSSDKTLPYSNDFESDIELANLEVEDTNTDNVSWHTINTLAFSNLQALRYLSSNTVPADDWFFTSCLTLTTGVSYQLEFHYRIFLPTNTHIFDVQYGSQANSLNMDFDIQTDITITGDSTYQLFSKSFTPAASGDYHIGFHARSDANNSSLRIDKIELSEISGIKEIISDFDLNIYPNPSSGKFIINSDEKINSIVVTNVLGQEEYSTILVNPSNVEIDLSDKPEGVYLIKVMTNVGIKTQKVTVIKN